jgi:hypothetical protein
MVIPDEGPGYPPLPGDAGPHETTLHDIYGFSSVLVRMTADDWGTTSDTVSNLAAEVRGVMSKLRGADRPWEGPAAESAYATLQTLASQLDIRADEIRGIKKGLTKAAEAADTARQAYQNTVRTISTDVDRSGYEKSVPRQGNQPVPDGKVFDQAAYDAAVSAQREQREQQAAAVLAAFRGDITGAAKEMPVEAQDSSVTITPGGGGGGGGGGNYPTGGSTGTGGYVAPTGTTWSDPPTTTTQPPTTVVPTEVICTGYIPPEVDPPVITEPTDVDLDGATTGTTTPTGPGSPDWAGTSPGGSTGGPGGISGGTGAGAIGGGALAGGAAMLGKSMLGRLGGGALGAAGRGSMIAGGSSGAAGRGTAVGRAGAGGAAGRGGMVAGGQGGAAGRGGGRGTGGVRGAKGTGRYGVPKLGEGSRGGRGAVAAGSGAGGRGGKKDKDGRAEGVDFLTHEDEETWFEGEDDATPPVWR